MSEHLSKGLLEEYVIGALDDGSMRFVEAHVEGCAACAALLAREARLEGGLYALGERAAVAPLLTGRRRKLSMAVAGIAVAAGVMVVVGLFDSTPPPEKHPHVRRCVDADAAKEGECLAQARFDGVISIGPGNQLLVPRYELVPETNVPGGEQ